MFTLDFRTSNISSDTFNLKPEEESSGSDGVELSLMIFSVVESNETYCLKKANEMAEKPDLNLSLICGALNIADNAIQKNFQVCILLNKMH